MRITSLIASSTEIICALGFDDDLVGRSHECDHREYVKRLPAKVAEALGAPAAGARLVASLRKRMAAVESTARRLAPRPRVACIEWIEPLMSGGNWMPEIVAMAGGASLFGQAGKHSPWLDWDDLRTADPDVVFVSPCGFDIPRTLAPQRAGHLAPLHASKIESFMRRFLSIFVLPFGLLCFQPDVLALQVDRAAYRYPYTDPYLATTTLSIAKGREVLLADDDVSRRSLEITVLDGRDNAYLLEGKGKLRFRFYQQTGSAPLIFIIPGLGGPAASGSAAYLAEVLVDQGFHVLILPSPFNWNFALAASRSGLPGITQEDSEDLYSAMQSILQHIKTHYGARVGATGLIGLSDGALCGAYIGKIDTEKRKIGILRYLLVNPPVDLLKAIAIIDQMTELGRKFETQQRKRIEAYGAGVAEQASGGHDPFNDPAYFVGWDKRFRLSDEQMQYLIGSVLQLPIGDVIYVRELVRPEGVLKTAISYENRTKRFYEAHSYGIRDYVRLFLIPRLEQRGRSQTINGAWKIGLSLKDVESTLVENKNMFVMHNRDDFLVSIEDLDYLEGLLGDRAKIYPYGGHMGNIWYWQNRNDIVSIFSSIKSESYPR